MVVSLGTGSIYRYRCGFRIHLLLSVWIQESIYCCRSGFRIYLWLSFWVQGSIYGCRSGFGIYLWLSVWVQDLFIVIGLGSGAEVAGTEGAGRAPGREEGLARGDSLVPGL